jgi:hypothetical protein
MPRLMHGNQDFLHDVFDIAGRQALAYDAA